MGARSSLQTLINAVQFRLDTFPRPDYQPVPWLGVNDAPRMQGTKQRWEIIQKMANEHGVKNAIDIGANMGFFSVSLAAKGIPTVGIEMEDRFVRVFRHVLRKKNISNVSIMHMEINPETAASLPSADMVLLLSVWHHWVRYMGQDVAAKLLSAVWERTNKVMLFETGENEMGEHFGLPKMEPNGKEWLTEYLRSQCEGSQVVHLGEMKAFNPADRDAGELITRNLFAVVRL